MSLVKIQGLRGVGCETLAIGKKINRKFAQLQFFDGFLRVSEINIRVLGRM
jgi:hypothetical protein